MDELKVIIQNSQSESYTIRQNDGYTDYAESREPLVIVPNSITSWDDFKYHLTMAMIFTLKRIFMNIWLNSIRWNRFMRAGITVLMLCSLFACYSKKKGGDDGDTPAAPTPEASATATTTATVSATTFKGFPEKIWRCESGCQLSPDLTPETTQIQHLAGVWVGSNGTRFKVANVQNKLAVIDFEEPNGVKGLGSFILQQSVITFSIRYRNSKNGALPRGLYFLKIKTINTTGFELESIRDLNMDPQKEPDLANFICQTTPCNNSIFPANLIQLTPANIAGAWDINVLSVPVAFTMTADGKFSFISKGTGNAAGQGDGTFIIKNGIADITLVNNTVPLIIERGLNKVALRAIEANASSLMVEVANTSVNTFRFICGVLDTANQPKCGRPTIDPNKSALTTEDFVGKWIGNRDSTIASALIIDTDGVFEIHAEGGLTASGIYTVSDAFPRTQAPLITFKVVETTLPNFPKSNIPFVLDQNFLPSVEFSISEK